MKVIILILLINAIILTQDITVFVGNINENDRFAKFERDIIVNFINTYNQTYFTNFTIKFEMLMLKNFFNKMGEYSKDDNVLGINSISITDDRKKRFDFSSPYIINRPIILKNKKNVQPVNLLDKACKIATIEGSIYEPMLITNTSKIGQSFILKDTFIELINGLKNNSIDYIYGDYVNIWNYDLELVKVLDYGKLDQNAIIYPKGSLLNKQINKPFEKFLKSELFFSLIKKHFGLEGINYFQRGLKKFN